MVWNNRLNPISKKRQANGERYQGLKRTPLRKISKKQAATIRNYRTVGFETWGHTCFLCGRDETETRLDIHHIDKNRRNNTPENLIPLCSRYTGCRAHSHMGSEGLYELNDKIFAKMEGLK